MSSAVVVCTWTASGVSLPGEVEEALTLGRKVSQTLSTGLHWLVLGPASDEAIATGAKFGPVAVHRVRDPKLDEFKPDIYVESLAQYCKAQQPRLMIFNQTYDVRLVAPRLAGRLGSGVVMNGVGLDTEGGKLTVTASAYGGDTRTTYTFEGSYPHIVSLLPNAVLPEPAGSGNAPVQDVIVDLAGIEERIRVVAPARTEGPRLEDAQIIVAGGRGLGSAANFRLVEDLADAMGGMAGASRPIVDDGWADASRQVGLTGKITRPALYIAAGISGASQHMAGCSAAKTLVAINRDDGAAIFRYARYGIVGDCNEILPELTKAVQGR